MKPQYRATAFVLLIALILLAGVFLKIIAQEKPKGIAVKSEERKVTAVDFKPGDAAQLALLRVQRQEIDKQISGILQSYNLDGSEIVTDARGNWTGLKMPEVKKQ